MKAMRTGKHVFWAFALVVAFWNTMVKGDFPAGTIVAAPALTPVEAAYSAIWDGFYGPGKGKLLLTATPALLPDGTPDFVVDDRTDEVSLLIHLQVNTPAFEAWRMDAHKRLAGLGVAQCRPVAIGAGDARIIGGQAFRFSDEGESRIRNWEKSPMAKRSAIMVRVEGFAAKGKPLGKWDVPMRELDRG